MSAVRTGGDDMQLTLPSCCGDVAFSGFLVVKYLQLDNHPLNDVIE